MPQSLSIVAQYCEDQFYQNYRPNSAFFKLPDFIFHAGQTISAIYATYYQTKYAEIKSEKKDEVVSFDSGLLMNEIVEVKNESGVLSAKLSQPYMAFLYDNQTTGLQDVFPAESITCELERTSLSNLWQLQYLPTTNKIFFYGDTGNSIGFISKGICNVKKVRVLYVPAVHNDMLVPDGIIKDAIATTVQFMRALDKETVIKKSLDQNQNKILQTEIDQKQLKP